MNTGYKMTMAFALLMIMRNRSAGATRANRSTWLTQADSANIKQQAAADSEDNEGSVVDEELVGYRR